MLVTLDKIQDNAEPMERVSCGFPMLDKAMGSTNGVDGFVRGGMYYLFGQHGVGKSRLSIQIMDNVSSTGENTMICQGEADLNEFANWMSAKPVSTTSHMHLTDDMEFSDLMKNIEKVRPVFTIVDSANMVNGISGLKDIQDKYRIWKQTVSKSGTVCILLGQLNQDGSLKGNTAIPHLVDVVGTIFRPKIKRGWFEVTAIDPQTGNKGTLKIKYGDEKQLKKIFRVWVPDKNRYGETELAVDFKHTDAGINYITSVFETEWNRLKWLMPVEEYAQAYIDQKYGSGSDPVPVPIQSEGLLARGLRWLSS